MVSNVPGQRIDCIWGPVLIELGQCFIELAASIVTGVRRGVNPLGIHPAISTVPSS